MGHQMEQYGQQMYRHGGHHGQVTDKQAMKEAMKFAKNKGHLKIDCKMIISPSL